MPVISVSNRIFKIVQKMIDIINAENECRQTIYDAVDFIDSAHRGSQKYVLKIFARLIRPTNFFDFNHVTVLRS